MLRNSQYALAVLLSLGMLSQSFAVGTAGFGNEAFSARSLGEGGVGVAGTTEDLGAIYANPAAVTTLAGTQATIGGTWENLHASYEGNNQSSNMRSIDVGVPNLAVTRSLMNNKLGAGLGVFSTYGLETHWPGDGSLRYIATNSRLHIIDVTPSVAYQILPQLSFGIGADYFNLNTADLEKNVNMNNLNNAILISNGFPPAFAGLSDADSKLSGSAANWGYHTGLMYRPNEQHSFGLVYHSPVKLNINGSVSLTNISGAPAQAVFGGSNYTTSAYTDLYLPQNLQFGYSYQPNDKWQFELDTAWYGWDSNKDLNVRYPDATAAQIALLTNNGAGNPTPLNWHNTWNLETGLNYKYDEHLQLRGGFYYEPAIVPESSFSPSLPDLSRYALTIGTGYAFTPSFLVDLAYNAIFEHNRSINNSIGQNSTGDPTVTTAGTYKNFTNLISLNLTYRFAGSH